MNVIIFTCVAMFQAINKTKQKKELINEAPVNFLAFCINMKATDDDLSLKKSLPNSR